jgi:hypothetical protein
MRKFYIFLFFSLISFGVFAQSKHDPRLLQTHDKDYLDRLELKSPAMYQKLNFYLDNTFYIAQYNREKFKKNLQTIKVKDLSNINIFEVQRENNIKPDLNKKLSFRIEGTDKVLILESMNQFAKAFNEARQSN